MRVAAIQHDIAWCEPEVNRARLAPMIASAAGQGAGLALLSETFPTGFATHRDDLGEAPDGPTVTWLVEQAAQHQLWVGGSLAETVDGRTYNTFVLAGPDGTQHRYRKVHQFSYGGEQEHWSPGSVRVVVEVDGLSLGLLVCYDLRFADAFWDLAPDVDAYLVVASWPASRRAHWQALLRARAIENQAWVVGCNRVGHGGGLSYAGDSVVVDPMGEVVADAPAGTEALVGADISRERVREVREALPFLTDRVRAPG